MKMKPIIFSTKMVTAILAGNKIMTRRVKGLKFVDKRATEIVRSDSWPKQGNWAARFKYTDEIERYEVTDVIKSPYENGDVLWVRETFSLWGFFGYYFKADFTERHGAWEKDNSDKINVERVEKWSPSIFMPKEAARLFLKITDVRVERLQEITEEDAVKEGFGQNENSNNYVPPFSAKTCFEVLWDSLNEKRGYGWRANPWIWIISFERIDKPENF